jgi:uncharacterized protein YbjT (DUF2867 family)
MTSRALIAGVTGLIRSNLVEHLASKGWVVQGIARKQQGIVPGVRPIAADLLEPEALQSSLAGVDPTHVFLTTWVRRATEEETIAANGARGVERRRLRESCPGARNRHLTRRRASNGRISYAL